jgi:hypothetical protein
MQQAEMNFIDFMNRLKADGDCGRISPVSGGSLI